ncbi:hypothetical protein Scep_015412 [Stephania cephalantha]|uniref:Uncharacterized protein n=1 Tax=Stephania cephalantha TaxID=152367 RepID=A0AAP0P3W4_9MAGN
MKASLRTYKALSKLGHMKHPVIQAKLQRRHLELTQATPDQPVDDEAVYLNVAGECPKGRVYGLGSLGRKNRRYADPGASTSQMREMVPRAEFDIVAKQLRKCPSKPTVMVFFEMAVVKSGGSESSARWGIKGGGRHRRQDGGSGVGGRMAAQRVMGVRAKETMANLVKIYV